ncbi:MAG TPA: hypothetical protein VJL90_14155 [Pseudorhodoplanes sp.]|nr:hypothetical protein [Pseudorhodoplanes sp.]
MILAKLVAATLVVSVAAAPTDPTANLQLSIPQKNAVTQAYVRSATDCVARVVAADVRFLRNEPALNLGDLIEQSMPKCIEPMRAMIDAFDLYFGEGTGERFFEGPYLDALPNSVVKLIANATN